MCCVAMAAHYRSFIFIYSIISINIFFFFFFCFFCFCFVAVQGIDEATIGEGMSRVAEGWKGAVASEDWRCSELGKQIMAGHGGNAADAAVAIAICIGVVSPGVSGIGGGGFLLFHGSSSSSSSSSSSASSSSSSAPRITIAYDFREVAPAAASEDMYAESKTKGGLSVAVPGEVAGLHLLWERHGTLPWQTLIQPSIELAELGFTVSKYLESSLNSSAEDILADQGLREVFAPNGSLLRAGDLCVRTSLAETLRAIACHGPDAFYRGTIAEKLVKDVQDKGGILTLQDLASYRATTRDPIVADILDFTIYAMPPPSSGGACLAMVLNILASYPNPREAVNGSLGLHRMVEAFKHAFAARMYLGDPDFVDVQEVLSYMLNSTFASELQKLIDDDHTFPPPYYGSIWDQVDDHGTCHFNVVDEDRNVVSLTTTVNEKFGAKFISRSTGIVLNNEMDDFSVPTSDPGASPPAPNNFIEPFKRPLSSMSPTIVLKDGEFLGALGGSGGSKIITTTIQVFLNMFWKGYGPLASITNPRLHHRLMPDVLDYEDWTTVTDEVVKENEDVVEYLESKGHITTGTTGGISHLIIEEKLELMCHSKALRRKMLASTGKLIAVSDFRKDGYPVAY